MTTPQRQQPVLSIIIPAYNEARRLPLALEQIRAYAERTGLRAEVIVVDDGSSDDTAKVARRFSPDPLPLTVLRNRVNRGKGYSVRRAMRKASGDVLLMTDADQSTPIWEIERAMPYLADGYDVVIGSRDMIGSRLEPPQGPARFLMGKLLRWVRRCLMLRDLCDTQCGFKLFSRQAGRRIFAAQRTNGFAFDVEALMLARRLGYRIKELGVLWCNDPDSRVRPLRDSVRMLAALLAMRWRLRRRRRPTAP